MKRLLLLCLFVVASVATAKPKVFFNYKIYYTPTNDAYVTTMLQFSGGTFKYLNTPNGNLRTSVEITQVFKRQDSVVLADKYILDSPEMQDSIVDDFFDVQHYGLEPGVYDYELIIKDLVSGEEVRGQQSLIINKMNPDKIQFSGVEFIQSAVPTEEKNNFVKNGYLLLPYMTNYYPPEMTKIAFYLELYNSQKVIGEEEKFLLTYSISNFDTNEPLEEIFQYQRLTPGPVVPVIGFLPIDAVPTGDFNLHLNVINKDNDTVASKIVFFQRRSDMIENTLNLDEVVIDDTWMSEIPTDSMHYFLGSIMPISPRYEYENIRKMLKTNDTTQMKKYFYSFWLKTDPADPGRAWYKYRRSIYHAEGLFGTQIKFAWETDRGRIWLKYGAPDQFIDRPNEPSAYPYQIWHYYRIGQRSNVRYVFYNPDLVTNDYPLLHSDMQGEIQNYRWQNDLHKRDANSLNVDDPGGSVHYGGNANVYFNEIDR